MAGRGVKISKDLIDEFVTYRENGMNVNDCCDLVGITEATYYRWMSEVRTGINADNPEKPVTKFALKKELFEESKKAEATFKAWHVQNIMNASKKNWQASAWMLERKYPKEYGRADRAFAILNDAKDNGQIEQILKYLGMKDSEKESDGGDIEGV